MLRISNSWSIKFLKDDDPRIREMAVRMLGRDCRENGKVEYSKPEAKQPAAALAHLDALKPMADDPDAGVRRELILAFRNLPTDAVGDSLRKLTAAWDGQDRWYLEALGLALEKRESDFLSTLFRRKLVWRARSCRKQAHRVTLRFRLISRLTETRRSSQRERRIAWFHRSASTSGWRGEFIGVRCYRSSSAFCPTCKQSSCNRLPTTSWSG